MIQYKEVGVEVSQSLEGTLIRPRTKSGQVTLALAHYDRHGPLIEGIVTLPGLDLRVMVVGQNTRERDGANRHRRMLREGEFDMAEVSLSSYLMAKDRGAPFSAIPVFPRRLFSLSQIWTRSDSGLQSPAELRGKRVGINTFQTTLSVLAKADLNRIYNLNWRDISWTTAREETIPFSPDEKVDIQTLKPGESLVDRLLNGALDAVMVPHPPEELLVSNRISRLLRDPQGEEVSYFNRFGYYPIMHVIAIRDDVLEKFPELSRNTLEAFDQSFEIAKKRWNDPNWSLLAWGRQEFERQQEQFKTDIWPNGLARNRENLAWFIEQSFDQGLISRVYDPSGLFAQDTLDS